MRTYYLPAARTSRPVSAFAQYNVLSSWPSLWKAANTPTCSDKSLPDKIDRTDRPISSIWSAVRTGTALIEAAEFIAMCFSELALGITAIFCCVSHFKITYVLRVKQVWVSSLSLVFPIRLNTCDGDITDTQASAQWVSMYVGLREHWEEKVCEMNHHIDNIDANLSLQCPINTLSAWLYLWKSNLWDMFYMSYSHRSYLIGREI